MKLSSGVYGGKSRTWGIGIGGGFMLSGGGLGGTGAFGDMVPVWRAERCSGPRGMALIIECSGD